MRRQRQHARDHAHRGTPSSARIKVLAAVDPWWCPPWSLAWQRAWQHIHDQVQAGHRLDADHHFRSFAPAQRTWLRQQRTHYDDLHPDQQRLLAGIGLNRESACTRPINPYAETALAHACAYAALHRTLTVAYSTVHDDFPFGRWLVQTRRKARQGRLSPTTHTLGPWWCPPWPHTWQRTYHQARKQHDAGQDDSPALQ
ncbi:Helicase associated domain protein [Streptomyces sp. NPDC007025]|uniref:Helicase associated domain protein n=1 Tax=Streptomyces sp. NPDC007025 TaxID=3364771 RepID=UPI0036C8E9C0